MASSISLPGSGSMLTCSRTLLLAHEPVVVALTATVAKLLAVTALSVVEPPGMVTTTGSLSLGQ